MSANDTAPGGKEQLSAVAQRTRPARGSYASGVAFGAASFALVAIVGVVSSIVTARIYHVRIIGEFALAYAPTSIVWFLSTVREQAALVRELVTLPPRHPRVTALFAAVFAFSTALTLTVSVLAAVAVWFVFHGPIDHPYLFLPACANLAAYTVLANPGWNLDSVFAAFITGRRLFWIRFHMAAANLVIAVAIGAVWRSVWGLVIATAGASLTSLVHRVISVRSVMRWRVPLGVIREGFRALPGILQFGIRAAPGAVLQGTATETGTWVLGLTSSVALVGAYNRANMLARKF